MKKIILIIAAVIILASLLLSSKSENSEPYMYELKESIYQTKTVLFISKGFTETDKRAIDKLK